ncbi:MAG: intradiol ring-cleavage dioxygenase [Thermomicrobiales bacterium]
MFSRSRSVSFHQVPAGVRRFYDESNKERYLATSRRTVVKAGVAMAAIGAGVSVAGVSVHAQSNDDTTPESTPDSTCVLTPQLTDGPYYLDDMVLREDVTEGKAGIPLELRMLVIDTSTCQPIENAAVEIWHCDALGFYSGFVENNPGGTDDYVDDGSDPETFFRGLQLTDAEGYATFQTIYPGWYAGRDIHIHLKIHVGGEADNGTYDGGHVSHSGQLAFADAITDEVALVEPYASKTDTFTRLEDDGVFRDVEEDNPTFFVELTQKDTGDIENGFTGTITLGVDSSTS